MTNPSPDDADLPAPPQPLPGAPPPDEGRRPISGITILLAVLTVPLFILAGLVIIVSAVLTCGSTFGHLTAHPTASSIRIDYLVVLLGFAIAMCAPVIGAVRAARAGHTATAVAWGLVMLVPAWWFLPPIVAAVPSVVTGDARAYCHYDPRSAT